MRFLGPALLLPLFLAGCAMSSAATAVSLVLEGVSVVVTTGKSTAGHAISVAAQEGCALLRVVEGREICNPDGEAQIALVGVGAANEDWLRDSQTGSPDLDVISVSELRAAAEPVAGQQLPSAMTIEPQHQAQTAILTPTPTPGPVGQGAHLSPLSDAIAAAAKTSPRDLSAKAQPTAKSLGRQLEKPKILKINIPQQPASLITRVIQGSGQVTTYAVIGSFRNAENARRAGEAQGSDSLIQTIEVNGTTTHRVLVEEARSDEFPDAWRVRLCSDDRGQPPCGQFVVSQGVVYIEMVKNQPRR